MYKRTTEVREGDFKTELVLESKQDVEDLVNMYMTGLENEICEDLPEG